MTFESYRLCTCVGSTSRDSERVPTDRFSVVKSRGVSGVWGGVGGGVSEGQTTRRGTRRLEG